MHAQRAGPKAQHGAAWRTADWPQAASSLHEQTCSSQVLLAALLVPCRHNRASLRSIGAPHMACMAHGLTCPAAAAPTPWLPPHLSRAPIKPICLYRLCIRSSSQSPWVGSMIASACCSSRGPAAAAAAGELGLRRHHAAAAPLLPLPPCRRCGAMHGPAPDPLHGRDVVSARAPLPQVQLPRLLSPLPPRRRAAAARARGVPLPRPPPPRPPSLCPIEVLRRKRPETQETKVSALRLGRGIRPHSSHQPCPHFAANSSSFHLPST